MSNSNSNSSEAAECVVCTVVSYIEARFGRAEKSGTVPLSDLPERTLRNLSKARECPYIAITLGNSLICVGMVLQFTLITAPNTRMSFAGLEQFRPVSHPLR